MADGGVAKLLIETELPISMTCAEATGIEKGSCLKLTDPFTAIIHSGDEDYFAGIAAEEKIGGDGKTKIAVYRRGIFRMETIAAITAGESVALSATKNKIKKTDATCVGGKAIGIALETSGGDTETIMVEIKPGANNNAYA